MNITSVVMYQVGNTAYPTLESAEDAILEKIDKLVGSVDPERKLDFKRAQIVAMVEHLLRNRREISDLLSYEFIEDEKDLYDTVHSDSQLLYPIDPKLAKPAKRKPWEK